MRCASGPIRKSHLLFLSCAAMAKSWHYPRWRRHVMQITMWIVLAGTVGLAMVVNHFERKALEPRLGAAQTIGDVTFRAPANWKPPGDNPSDPQTLITLLESDDDSGRARSISILRQRGNALKSPLEYLMQHGVLKLPINPGSYRTFVAHDRSWTLVAQYYMTPQNHGGEVRMVSLKFLHALTILPDGQVIRVRLSGAGEVDATDEGIVKAVAESIEIPNAPQLSDEPTIKLPGLNAKPPADFAVYSQPDPNRLDRQIIAQDQTKWTGITLISCVAFDGERLRDLLLPHEGDWRQATVTELSPRVWRIDPPQSEFSQSFPQCAYVAANENGRALLAIFRGGYGQSSSFEPAWEQIQSSLEFIDELNPTEMVKAGADEVQRMQQAGLQQLLGNSSDEGWWLWMQRDVGKPIGWTRIEAKPKSFAIRNDTCRQLPGGQVVMISRGWEGSSDLTTYSSVRTIFRAAATVESTFGLVGVQKTILRNGRLHIESEGTVKGTRAGAAPPNFFPGGRLEELIPQLSAVPMILLSESFGDFDLSADPVTLIVVPENRSATTQPDAALQSITVQINGSGAVDRWSFSTENGIQSVDEAGGIRRLPSNYQLIRSSFGPESLMYPQQADDKIPE
jgi:hypothetical protein